MKLEFSAGGIIYRKEKKDFEFVLILNSYGKWTFPKGRIEKEEKPEEAALREVGEEIGLKNLKVIKLLAKIDYWYKEKDTLIHKFVDYFLMRAENAKGLKPQMTEIKDVRWFKAPEARQIFGYPEDRKLLEKSLEVLNPRQK